MFPALHTISKTIRPAVHRALKRSVPLWMAALTLFLAIEALYLYRKNNEIPLRLSTASFEECLTAEGSSIRDGYPTTCITADGTAFIEPRGITDESSSLSGTTTDWNAYTNNQYFFTFKCPPASAHTITTTPNRDGVVYPYYRESCTEQEHQITISVWKTLPETEFTRTSVAAELSGASLTPVNFIQEMTGKYARIRYNEQNTSGQTERFVTVFLLPDVHIRIEGFPETYYDRVLSTFTFINTP